MLAERKQQPEQRHEKHTAANAEHSGSHAAHTCDREDPHAAASCVRHERASVYLRLRVARAAISSRAKTRPASENSQTSLSDAARAWERQSSCPHNLRKAFRVRIIFRLAPPPGPVSNIGVIPPSR